MDVNGKTLTITGTVNQYGKIYINSGKITVGGYYYQRDGVLDFNNGRLEVGKNYRLQSISKDENNKNVYGTCYGVIKMDDEDDYFLVKGSMFVQSYWGDGESNNDLTNGTLELQGDFTQLNGGGRQKETIRSYSQAISSRLSILKVREAQALISFRQLRIHRSISRQAE